MSFGLVLFFKIPFKKLKMHTISKEVYLQKVNVSSLSHSLSVWWLEKVHQRLGTLLKWKQRLCRQTTSSLSETEGGDSRRVTFQKQHCQ